MKAKNTGKTRIREKGFFTRNHTGFPPVLLILILAASLAFSTAAADSLFSIADTPAPPAVRTPAPRTLPAPRPVPAGRSQDLFSQLVTATPSPTPVPTPTPTPVPTPEPTASDSASPAETPSLRLETEVCSHCDYGFCRRCEGIGFFKCDSCGGKGVCPVCMGRERRLPNFGGVKPSTYITCGACRGSKKCSRCGGEGSKDCPDCEGGTCPYCHGDYFLEPEN